MMLRRYSILSKMPEFAGGILIAVAALTIWMSSLREGQSRWVQHTLEVQNAISSLETALLEAQSGNRGFIITGDETYLEPYHRGVADLDARLTQVSTLVADSAQQTESIKQLQPIIRQRLDALAEGINLRRASGMESAIEFIKAHNGSTIMRSVRGIIKEMKDREGALLVTRQASARRIDLYLSLLCGLGVVAAMAVSGIWIASSRRMTRELQASIAEREAAEAQVRQMQKMEAIGQLTGGIAHDFNNMLAVIISALTLMQKRVAAGDMQIGKFVDAAMDGATRAATLTKRLTAFSRQQALSPQPINCNKFIAGLSELVERAIGGNVKVETVLGGGLWLTYADASQLENAVVNLAVNARDAMPEGGKLTIETSNAYLDERYARMHSIEPGQYVLVAMTDNGCGMSPEIVGRAFDPFFTTKDTGKGTGLGLSQVHGFVRQSGGHVKIYSELGQGTTLKIYLPRYYGDEKRTVEEPAVKQIPSSDAGRYTVLVVEDDEQVRKGTTTLVREMGYRVLEAENAEAALAILDLHAEIAILFTDIVMPGLNGRKLADEAVRRRPNLKVLFTTGFTRNAIVHHGVLDPGVEYIAKPFTIDELAAKLQPIVDTVAAAETNSTS